MERKRRYFSAASGLALSIAAITGACGGERSPSKNAYPTQDSTSVSCFDQSLGSTETAEESKSKTEARLNDTISFMECSAIEPLMQFADKLKQLHLDGYLLLDDFKDPNEIANITFYGGFPTRNDSSYRMTVDLNKNGMSYADYAIFLFKETLVLTTLNEKIKNAPNAGTKIASGEDRTSIECLAWVNTIKNVGIPLKGEVEVETIKSIIKAYEHQDPDGIIDCINSSDLN